MDFYLEYHSRWWWDVSPDCALRGILVHLRDSAPLSVACGEYFVMDEVESSVCRCLRGEVGWGRFERGCKGLGCRGGGKVFWLRAFSKISGFWFSTLHQSLASELRDDILNKPICQILVWVSARMKVILENIFFRIRTLVAKLFRYIFKPYALKSDKEN